MGGGGGGERMRENDHDTRKSEVPFPTYAKSQLIDNLVGRDFSISIFLESLLDGIQSTEQS